MEEINNCRICKSDKIEKIFNKTFYLSNLKEKNKNDLCNMFELSIYLPRQICW